MLAIFSILDESGESVVKKKSTSLLKVIKKFFRGSKQQLDEEEERNDIFSQRTHALSPYREIGWLHGSRTETEADLRAKRDEAKEREVNVRKQQVAPSLQTNRLVQMMPQFLKTRIQ